MDNKTLGNFLTQANKDFPLDCETLENLQNLAALAELCGNIGGDKVILSGCEASNGGSRRGAGWVFLRTKARPDGEVLRWEGGATTSGMYVKQEDVPVSANNTDYPKAYTRRSLAPGIGTENYRWEAFTELKSVKALMAECEALRRELTALSAPPLGIVQMWAGKVVPEGYVLCNGQELRQSEYPDLYKAIGATFNNAANANGTTSQTQSGFFRVPDLRGRFIVGKHDSDKDYMTAGSAGGSKKVTLTENEIPSHSHVQTLWAGASGTWKGGGRNSWPDATANFGGVDRSRRTENYGNGGAHENRPPYYVLAYIMRAK